MGYAYRRAIHRLSTGIDGFWLRVVVPFWRRRGGRCRGGTRGLKVVEIALSDDLSIRHPQHPDALSGGKVRTVKFRNQEHLRQFIASAARGAIRRELGSQRGSSWMTQILATPEKPTRSGDQRGLKVARLIRALAAGNGNPQVAQQFAVQNGYDEMIVKALGTSDASAGGFLVPSALANDLIDLLAAKAIVRQFPVRVWDLPRGALSFPRLDSGATAAWVAENENITASEPTTGLVNLVARKLAALVPISNELLADSSPAADQIVRDDLVRTLTNAQDLAFINGDGTSNQPVGLRNQIAAANVNAQTGTTTATAITDLETTIGALEDQNVDLSTAGWIMAPRTLRGYRKFQLGGSSDAEFAFRDEIVNKGTLYGYPVRTSTQVPVNLGGGSNESYTLFVAFGDVIIGEADGLRIDVSDVAAYHDGVAVQAAFSRDQAIVRAVLRTDLAMRHDLSGAVISAVTIS